MSTLLARTRETSELPFILRSRTETLLKIRKSIKEKEKALDQEKKIVNKELLSFLDSQNIETIYSPESGSATATIRSTKTLNKDLLIEALEGHGLSRFDIVDILNKSYKISESEPYITFNASKEEK